MEVDDEIVVNKRRHVPVEYDALITESVTNTKHGG